MLLLFLMRAACATPSIYVVTGIGYTWGVYEGVYEEKREPELHYKKLDEVSSGRVNQFWFLYTDSLPPQSLSQIWIIGRGKTLSTAWAWFRAPAREGTPVVTQMEGRL